MTIESDYKPTWQEILRAERKKQGLSQPQVAKKLGISFMALSHWELGRREPKLAEIEEWAKVLGLDFVIKISPKQKK